MNEHTVLIHITNLFLIILLLATTLWILRKTTRIHRATFQLLADTKVIRHESSVLFAQLQALARLESKLGLPEPLPPMRGWAGSPDFLLTVADQILQRKPLTVVECSSGVSTVVIARCMQMIGTGHVYSLEHDEVYASQTLALLHNYGLTEWATVLYAPLVADGGDTLWYDDSVLPSSIGSIQALIVDGPPMDTAPLARLPALPRLITRMADTSIIILDDAARDAEQEIVRRWIEMAPEYRANYLHHEKGCMVLVREPKIL